MNLVPVLVVLVKSFEDGKITGKELKEVLNLLIPDNLEFSLNEILGFLKVLLKKL
jgi:hypothetical protein